MEAEVRVAQAEGHLISRANYGRREGLFAASGLNPLQRLAEQAPKEIMLSPPPRADLLPHSAADLNLTFGGLLPKSESSLRRGDRPVAPTP